MTVGTFDTNLVAIVTVAVVVVMALVVVRVLTADASGAIAVTVVSVAICNHRFALTTEHNLAVCTCFACT